MFGNRESFQTLSDWYNLIGTSKAVQKVIQNSFTVRLQTKKAANWNAAPASEGSGSSSTNLFLQCSFCLRLSECLWLFSWLYVEHHPVVFQRQKEPPIVGYTRDCMTPPREPKETTTLASNEAECFNLVSHLDLLKKRKLHLRNCSGRERRHLK